MASRVLEVDRTGAKAASLGENRRELDERQRGDFGADLAMSPQTPQSQWSGIVALRDTELGEGGVRVAIYGSSVDHAPGTFLDALGSNFGINRRVATRSRVTATLTGVAGTGVPSGSRAKTDPGNYEFRTISDAILSPSGTTAEMEAIEEGAVPAPAGSLTRIVTVIAGWETITNAEHAAQGIARQTDDDYRRTYIARTARLATGALPALTASLEESMAQKTRVAENNTSVDRIVQGWTLRPHSILAVVQSGSDADVRRSVENHRGMGVATNTAIIGGAIDDAALNGVTAGDVMWGGVSFTGLDLSAQAGAVITFSGGGGTGTTARAIIADGGTVERVEIVSPGTGYSSAPTVAITAGSGAGATFTAVLSGDMVDSVTVTAGGADYLTDDQRMQGRADALTAQLASSTESPVVAYSAGRFVVQFLWAPDASPNFDDGAVPAAFGLDHDTNSYPAGPFVRPIERALAVSFTLTQGARVPRRRAGASAPGRAGSRCAVQDRRRAVVA